MRNASKGLNRFLVTPQFQSTVCSCGSTEGRCPPMHSPLSLARTIFSSGVVHSRAHELWARGLGGQVREVESGFRYTPTTTFETFPFPRSTDEQREAVAAAARSLDTLRQGWLNPSAATEDELRNLTLTNLYNKRPTWLRQAHERLDRTVYAAYGWHVWRFCPPIAPHCSCLVRSTSDRKAMFDQGAPCAPPRRPQLPAFASAMALRSHTNRRSRSTCPRHSR